jgi:uncharacterized protein (TIGR03032 family)
MVRPKGDDRSGPRRELPDRGYPRFGEGSLPRSRDGRCGCSILGNGTLEVVDLATGSHDVVETFPGYVRGLAFCGQGASVGLSRIHETSVFGGLPIGERRGELKCGVSAVNRQSGQTLATLQFESGVEEIFDVQVLTQARFTALCGPRPDQDGAQDISVVSKSSPHYGFR